MRPVSVVPREWMVPQPGRIYFLPDTRHPEIDPFTTLDEAGALICICHPDDEQRIRDALAIEQERPGWWRQLRRLETALAAAVGEPRS